MGRRQQEDFGLHLLGVDAGTVPVVRGFGIVQLGTDHPVQIVQGLAHLVGVGETVHGVDAEDKTTLDLAVVHLVHDIHVRIVRSRLALGQQAVAEVVFRLCFFTEPALEQAGEVLGPVAPPVGTVGDLGDRGIGLVELGQGLPGRQRQADIPGQHMVQQGMVRGALHIGLATQGVDAATGHTDIAQQQLHQRGAADVLHAHGMLGPAQCVQDGAGLVGLARGTELLVDLEQVFFGNTRDVGDVLQGVPRVMLLHQVEDAALVLQRGVTQRGAVRALFEAPLALVILARLGVIAAEKAVLEVIALADDERGVGIVDNVIVEIAVRFQDVIDHTAQERDIRTGAQRHMIIATGGRAGELGVDVDKRRAVVLGPHDPFERNRMMFSGIAADNKNHVGILDVDPVVGHSTASERLCQSRNSGAVSDPCLVVQLDNTQAAHGLMDNGAFLVGGVRGAHHENAFQTVDRLALAVFEDQILVTRILHATGDLFQHPSPVLFFPLFTVGRPVQGLGEAMRIRVHGEQGGTLGAQGTFVDGEIGIPLCADELAVAHISDDLTADGAERTDRDDFLCALYLETPGIGLGLAEVETELAEREAEGTHACQFQESPSCVAHRLPLLGQDETGICRKPSMPGGCGVRHVFSVKRS